MTLSIAKTNALIKRATTAADLNSNKTLATQEIKNALESGIISKPKRDVLTAIGAKAGNSRGGLETQNYARWLDRYTEAAVAADEAGNRDGKLDRAEINAAASNFRTADGTNLFAVRTVLTKLSKVSAEAPASLDTAVAASKLESLYSSRSRSLTSLASAPVVTGMRKFTVPNVVGRGFDTVDKAVGYVDAANSQVFFNVAGTEKLPWESISSDFSSWYSVPFAKVQ